MDSKRSISDSDDDNNSESENGILTEEKDEITPLRSYESKDTKAELPEDNRSEPIAPDGEWGWVVLVASFLSSVIVDGVCFSFGILYIEFLDYFHDSKGKTAWIGSVLNGTYMIMGPIAGALANKFGCRIVAIVGSVWASLAFVLCTLSPSVDILILTYGVLGGIGFGLMYLPSIVMVGFYFDKKRALATGIATCGSGIGAFIFAPLCKVLIEAYTWKGTEWILGGIVLNGVVIGALYRPLTIKEMDRYKRKWKRKEMKKMLKDSQHVETSLNNINTNHVIDNIDCPPSSGTHVKRPMMPTVDSWHSLSGLAEASVENIYRVSESSEKQSNYINSVNSRHLGSMAGSSKRATCVSILKDLFLNLKQTMDFSMMKDPVFVIYCISCLLCMAGFFTPFIYLPDKALGLGFGAEKATFLLSTLGITNIVGRVLSGWVSDRPWADCLVINNCALVTGGVATALCPFCFNYASLATYAAIFGLCIAAFVSLRSIILVDLIGIDKLTSAFGIIVLFQGISSFVGAPIAGFISDATGSYDVAFHISGFVIALSGAICFPLRRLAARRRAKAAKTQGGLTEDIAVE